MRYVGPIRGSGTNRGPKWNGLHLPAGHYQVQGHATGPSYSYNYDSRYYAHTEPGTNNVATPSTRIRFRSEDWYQTQYTQYDTKGTSVHLDSGGDDMDWFEGDIGTLKKPAGSNWEQAGGTYTFNFTLTEPTTVWICRQKNGAESLEPGFGHLYWIGGYPNTEGSNYPTL